MRKIISLIVGLCIALPVYAASQANKPHVSFLIMQEARFKMDFSRLSKHTKLVLLTSPYSYSRLDKKQRKHFYKIMQVNDFSYDNLQTLMHNLLNELRLDPQKETIAVSTIDESLVETVGLLQAKLDRNATDGDFRRFRNKLLMKQRMKMQGIAIPNYVPFSNAAYQNNPMQYLEFIQQALGPYPFFAKPIDGAGSYDSVTIQNSQELMSWADQHKEWDNYEIDEFIDGKLYYCDVIVQNNTISHIIPGWFSTPNADILHGKVLGSLILDESEPIYPKLCNMTKQVFSALSPLPNGLFHLEIFENKNNKELLFLEVAYRPAGVMILETYEKAFGINTHEIHIGLQLGIPIPIPKKLMPAYYVAGCWFPIQMGKVKAYTAPNIQSAYTTFWIYNVGDYVSKPPTNMTHRMGGLLLYAKDKTLFMKDVTYMTSGLYVPFIVQP